MGAWGTGVFEDDTALDFLEEELLINSDPLAVMKKAFHAALHGDYIDYEMAHAVLVSAKALHALQDQHPFEEDEDPTWTQWRTQHNQLDTSMLNPLAHQACLKVLKESELRELWEENQELFPQWKKGVEELAQSFEQ